MDDTSVLREGEAYAKLLESYGESEGEQLSILLSTIDLVSCQIMSTSRLIKKPLTLQVHHYLDRQIGRTLACVSLVLTFT